jgi:hypothetical protein
MKVSKIFGLVVVTILAIWGSGWLWSMASVWISKPSDLGVIGAYVSYAAVVIFWGAVLVKVGRKLVRHFL